MAQNSHSVEQTYELVAEIEPIHDAAPEAIDDVASNLSDSDFLFASVIYGGTFILSPVDDHDDADLVVIGLLNNDSDGLTDSLADEMENNDVVIQNCDTFERYIATWVSD